MTSSLAVAHSNIALAKYWGKADRTANLPAVPSLSLTLDALSTKTRVTFDPELDSDQAVLDETALSGRPLERVTALLDRVRKLARIETRARVESMNDFPTASGLASSASGFAALALAATAAAGLELDRAEISALARASSASAARSLFGGWATLGAGAEAAEQLAGPEHFPVVMLVAVTAAGPKAVGSTEGMLLTAETSPYYASWLEAAPRIFAEVERAVLARDLEALGAAMEQSALCMHASMLGAKPAVIYFSPATLSVLERVRALRQNGFHAYYTMDAGPHVKVLTEPERAAEVAQALSEIPSVLKVITCRPGPDAKLVDPSLPLGSARGVPEP